MSAQVPPRDNFDMTWLDTEPPGMWDGSDFSDGWADTEAGRYPSLEEAICGAFRLGKWPVGPMEAANIAAKTMMEWTSGELAVCACGWVVVLCQHHQPWKPTVTDHKIPTALDGGSE